MQLPAEVLPDCETAEAEAWADCVRGAAEHDGNSLLAGVRHIGGATAVVVGAVDSPQFNRVMALGISNAAAEADLEALLSFYREHHQRSVSVLLAPQARPIGLQRWITDRGLHRGLSFAKLWRRAGHAPTIRTTLRIEVIGAERAMDFARVNCRAWDLPRELSPWFSGALGRDRWRHYLAFDDREPVATGAMYILDDTCWLGFGATVPTYRHQGAHGALLVKRIHDATRLGCRFLVTETPHRAGCRPSVPYRNMVRVGFRLAYLRPSFVRRRR